MHVVYVAFAALWILLVVALRISLAKIGAALSIADWARLVVVSVPSWLAMMLFRLLFYVAGFPLVALQSANVGLRDSKQFPGRTVLQFNAWWMWPWNNPEDGVDGLRGGDPAQAAWLALTREYSVRWRIFKWSACRNPINNLRYVPFLSPIFAPKEIGYIGTGNEPPDGQSGWAYVWQGFYSGLYIKTPTRWFWLGWKFKPADANGVSATDTRMPRCDFATQFQRVSA